MDYFLAKSDRNSESVCVCCTRMGFKDTLKLY